ncbi:MAG: hypothetical protein JWO48_2069, partial [Bryobacterales bacterium]|nr:hypothetical protein [Bryobacterales bacterium]
MATAATSNSHSQKAHGRPRKSRSVEILMNFMIMDVNRNAMRKNPAKSIAGKVAQMA